MEEPKMPFKTRKILICFGILSSFLYLATDIIAVLLWKEYSIADQTVSELFAVHAPTKRIVVFFFIIYALLIYAFSVGVYFSAGKKKAIRMAAILIAGKEVLGLAGTLFFPIHLRGVPGNYSDIMHGVVTAMGVFLFMFTALGFGAVALGKKIKIYSVLTMVLFILFGVLAGLRQPAYAANLPTPGMGILERINIYGYMTWIIVFAYRLFSESKNEETGRT
jgi:hypothetical membrane protein